MNSGNSIKIIRPGRFSRYQILSMLAAGLLAVAALVPAFINRRVRLRQTVLISDLDAFRAAQETYKATFGNGREYGNVRDLINNGLLSADALPRPLCPNCSANHPDYQVWMPEKNRVYYMTRSDDSTRYCIRGTRLLDDEAFDPPPAGKQEALAMNTIGVIYAGTRDGTGCRNGDVIGNYLKEIFDR